jgi:hypothetical protein
MKHRHHITFATMPATFSAVMVGIPLSIPIYMTKSAGPAAAKLVYAVLLLQGRKYYQTRRYRPIVDISRFGSKGIHHT